MRTAKLHFFVFIFLTLFTQCEAMETTPKYLYKIVSIENWEQSQGLEALVLTKEDDEFVHFAEESQVERIIDKFWPGVPRVVVLKIDPSRVKGRWVLESNPGGTNKYYHLYEGSIPLEAVLESKVYSKIM